MKKKLLIFHPALAPYRIDFFNGLSRRFNAAFYFTHDNVLDQKFDQKSMRSALENKFNLLSKGFDIRNKAIRFGIFRIIENTKAEIVICSEYSQITLITILYNFLKKNKIKIYTISDDSLNLSVNRKGLRKIVRNLASHFVEGIIFPSQKVCDWFSENVNMHTKTFVLPIIHENEVFREKLNNALPFTEKNIQKFDLIDKNIFLFTGRLVKIKNVAFLLNAFAKSKTKNDFLVIVGDGEEMYNLKELAENLNLNKCILFTGRLEGSDLISWYNIANFFILPSYVEPYGAVVNEALIAGCKVLCSNLAGASELVNSTNGNTFDPFNEKELCSLIVQMSKVGDRIKLPIIVKPDRMPFKLENKLDILLSEL